MWTTFFVICLMLSVIGCIRENIKNKKNIYLLEEKIKKLQYAELETIFAIEGKTPEDILLRNLRNQAERLEFCYRCPLYRKKVQEDTRQ